MSQDWGPWIGASGTEYIFHVYDRGEDVPSRQGLYIYCLRDPKGMWAPLYMGQGDLSVCCADPDILACIGAKGATHVHMRLCPSPEEGEAELADLLGRYRNAYAPWGCHAAPPAPAGDAPGGSAILATA